MNAHRCETRTGEAARALFNAVRRGFAPDALAVVEAARIELLKVEFGAIEISDESEQGQ